MTRRPAMRVRGVEGAGLMFCAAAAWLLATAAGAQEVAAQPASRPIPAPLTLTIRNQVEEPALAWAPRPPDAAPRGKRSATVSYAVSPSTTLFFDVRKDRRPAAMHRDGDWTAAQAGSGSGRGYMLGLARRW